VDLVRAVRRRFGNISLMVDANTSYQLDDTGIFEELDRFDLMMIEQPLEREALTEHAELQRRLHTSICLDESAHDLESVRQGSARILNIKVQRIGGVWPARQAHDLARAAGISCWLGTMPELGSPRCKAYIWRHFRTSRCPPTLWLRSAGSSMT